VCYSNMHAISCAPELQPELIRPRSSVAFCDTSRFELASQAWLCAPVAPILFFPDHMAITWRGELSSSSAQGHGRKFECAPGHRLMAQLSPACLAAARPRTAYHLLRLATQHSAAGEHPCMLAPCCARPHFITSFARRVTSPLVLLCAA
jgi:hypothetical protein